MHAAYNKLTGTVVLCRQLLEPIKMDCVLMKIKDQIS